MSYLREESFGFADFDARAGKGDRAKIHGVSVGEFLEVQRLLTDTEGSKSDNTFRANLRLVALSCHELQIGGKTLKPTEDDIGALDALYYQVLLSRVLSFHDFSEQAKN
ncbi:MAG: hypothetical protein KBC24_04245 [Caldisericia bacterium]|nr:hypothetical protein [Caldisericia bacterium]